MRQCAICTISLNNLAIKPPSSQPNKNQKIQNIKKNTIKLNHYRGA